jgi:hypothetical protein
MRSDPPKWDKQDQVDESSRQRSARNLLIALR